MLAIDLCLGACVAAVGADRGETILANLMTRGHQERIAPLVQEVMADSGLEFSALDRVGVTVGPGSFTGLRVGLSFAKSLALALDRPCIGFSALEALAASAPGRGVVAAAIPARGGQVYSQIFVDGAAVTAPDLLDPSELAARLADIWRGGPLDLVGPEASALQGLAPEAATHDLVHPSGAALIALTRARPHPAAAPRPLYLRAPDARTIAERQALSMAHG